MTAARATFAPKYRINTSDPRQNPGELGIQFGLRKQSFDLGQKLSAGRRELCEKLLLLAGNWIRWIASMRIHSTANNLTLVVSLTLIVGSAIAQTCDSLLGGANCGARPQNSQQNGQMSPSNTSRGNADWRLGSGSATGGLGNGLSSRDDQAATFGAITFGGGGATCSGPFRSRNC
jgi:hypothetical protein